jgi:hypothetical protein
MKEIWLEILWNEEIRRCGVVDIERNAREARMRWYGHIIIRRDAGKPVERYYGMKRSEEVGW